jgi:hypothetical protein
MMGFECGRGPLPLSASSFSPPTLMSYEPPSHKSRRRSDSGDSAGRQLSGRCHSRWKENLRYTGPAFFFFAQVRTAKAAFLCLIVYARLSHHATLHTIMGQSTTIWQRKTPWRQRLRAGARRPHPPRHATRECRKKPAGQQRHTAAVSVPLGWPPPVVTKQRIDI